MGDITLGHVLIGVAALDLIFTLLVGMRMASAQSELPPEKRNSAPYLIFAAGIVGAALLCILAYYLPAAQTRLF